MNIYIYGNQGFKKEIHQTLEHANIKFKIGSDSIIKDIISLDELKQTIKTNPDDIYLIDDEKIIKKNSINKKIKFLTPKDGIEEEFLKENRIGEASVNSLDELPKYILRKYTELKSVDSEIQQSIIGIVDKAYEDNLTEEEEIVLDEELSMLLSKDNDIDELKQNDTFIDNEDDVLIEDNDNESYTKEIETSFSQAPIVDELENMLDNMDDLKVEQISPENLNSIEDFNQDVGLNNITFDYDHGDSNSDIDDDFLKQLESTKISNDDFKEEEKSLEFNGNIDDFLSDLELTTSVEAIEDNNLENYLEEEFDSNEDIKFEENIEIPTIKNDTIEKISKGEENMMDEFSQLDSLSEKDILEALENISTPQVVEKEIKKSSPQLDTISNNISISTGDSQDLIGLLTKLLNNKTLEITIKIKD